MKKLITFLLILSLSFTLFSCVDGNGGGGEGGSGGGSEGGGSGDGGSAIDSCPGGGEHDYVDNVCTKCKAFYDPEGWT